MKKRVLTMLLFGLALAGCDTFDPLDKFQEWDIMGSSKTPLKGERRPVFDSGVPGVAQGVPPELVKGYQPPAEEPPPVVTAKPAKSAKPKKAATKPRRPPPQQTQQDEPEPPQMRQAPAARTTTQAAPRGGDTWPTMPGAQPTWPSDAQPAPSR
ncbi:MAG: hypothetical protein V7604_361 [Hyphomicrobiales bacterium]